MKGRTLASFAVVLVLWLSQVHRLLAPTEADLAQLRDAMTARQSAAPDPSTMRAVNPEWDFMQRTYVVLALANQALIAPPEEREAKLSAIDAIIAATLADEARAGQSHFMLGYAKAKPFVDADAGSVFIDGELLAMMSARELVEARPEWRDGSRARVARVAAAMSRSPTLSAESYPDECWTFCNTTALAALTMFDRVDGSDHRALAAAWVTHAREHLVDPDTGLLVSSFTRDGRVLDGPEGSSIWMSAHNLLVVDEAFARDQYDRARRELAGRALGFGWAREWPRGVAPRPDVDSGPIVPLLDASAGSSGLALLGATAFGDHEYRGELFTSLELAGFRSRASDRYLASNAVGDAVVLYSLSFGPLWAAVRPAEPRS